MRKMFSKGQIETIVNDGIQNKSIPLVKEISVDEEISLDDLSQDIQVASASVFHEEFMGKIVYVICAGFTIPVSVGDDGHISFINAYEFEGSELITKYLVIG